MREVSVMTVSKCIVSNIQTISTIHSFLLNLIDQEQFLCSESDISVSSQLALSVQGHSTSDRPLPPRDAGLGCCSQSRMWSSSLETNKKLLLYIFTGC